MTERNLSWLPTVEGLEVDPSHTHMLGHMKSPQVRLRTPDGLITLDIDLKPNGTPAGAGHTTFKTKHGTRTFDRHGVDDSFYVENWKKLSLGEILAEQLVRARQAIKEAEDSVVVPGLQFKPMVTPVQLAKYRADLNLGLGVTLVPGGLRHGIHRLQEAQPLRARGSQGAHGLLRLRAALPGDVRS